MDNTILKSSDCLSHMVYEPLYLALQIWQLYVSLFLQISKGRKEISIFCRHLKKKKTSIPLALVAGYEMIIANSVLSASLAIYHLVYPTTTCGIIMLNIHDCKSLITTCFAKLCSFPCHFTMSIQAANCIVSRLIF